MTVILGKLKPWQSGQCLKWRERRQKKHKKTAAQKTLEPFAAEAKAKDTLHNAQLWELQAAYKAASLANWTASNDLPLWQWLKNSSQRLSPKYHLDSYYKQRERESERMGIFGHSFIHSHTQPGKSSTGKASNNRLLRWLPRFRLSHNDMASSSSSLMME